MINLSNSTDEENAVLARSAWLLYSDISTRLSILREECAHLQSTVMGLAKSKYVDAIASGAASNRGSYAEAESREREFLPPPEDIHRARRELGYSQLSPAEKTYAHLVELLGAMLVGIGHNKDAIRKSYIQFVLSCQNATGGTSGHAAKKSFFHFVNLRGSLLNAAIETYTSDLEMAHEKVVQVLENHAGNLPQPILFRRWNSALIEGFLSDYSRHISWQVGRIMDLRLDPEKTPHTILHTWTHSHTSHFESRRVSGKERASGKDRHHHLSLVRSAYFYLEQPILLPLLYHEMAHSTFERSEAPTGGGERRSFGAKFVEARRKFVEALMTSLRSEAPKFEPYSSDLSFWDTLSEEIWSDALSIASGGRSYLMALALQLCGQDGAVFYPIFEAEEELHVAAYDRFASLDHFVENPGPLRLSTDYFWEARLKIAAWLLSQLSSGSKEHDVPNGFAESLSDLIDYWWDAGDSIYKERHVMAPMDYHWQVRREVNQWLFDSALQYLRPLVLDLIKRKNKVESSWLKLSGKNAIGMAKFSVPESIGQVVFEYLQTYFPQRHEWVDKDDFIKRFKASVLTLEDPALQTRLAISAVVVDHFGTLKGDESRLEEWLRVFGDYCRHDGSTAFRLALEAILARDSLLLEIADCLDARCTSSNRPSDIKCDHASNIICNYFPKKLFEKHARKISGFRRYVIEKLSLNDDEEIFHLAASIRVVFNAVDDPRQRTFVDFLNELSSPMLDNLFGSLFSMYQDCSRTPAAQVGTFQLGYIKPGGLSSNISGSPFPKQPSDYGVYENVREINRQIVKIFNAGSSSKGIVYSAVGAHAIGDYSFVSYTQGMTPSEQDWHGKSGQMDLVKPRVTISVGRPSSSLGERLPSERFSDAIGNDRCVRVVCLVKQRYRWRWFHLFEMSQRLPYGVSCDIALSSAWEDLVLVIRAPTYREILQTHSTLGLDATTPNWNRTDTQSVILPSACFIGEPQSVPVSEVAEWRWDVTTAQSLPLGTPQFAISFRDTARVFSAFGRHDYVIAPIDQTDRKRMTVSNPSTYFSWLFNLDRSFWSNVENYSTIIEWKWDVAPTGDISLQPLFMLRINMRSGA